MDLEHAKTAIIDIYHWFIEYFFDVSTLAQLGVVIGVVLFSWWVALKTNHILIRTIQRIENFQFIRLYISPHELAFLIYAIVLLWSTVLMMTQFEKPVEVLDIAASLLTAWGGIRLIACTIKSPFWSKCFVLILSVVAGLNIIGLLDETFEVLDQAAIMLGNYRLSLLVVFKGFIAFGILLWLANTLSDVMNRFLQKSSGLTIYQKALFHKIGKILLITFAILLTLSVLGIDLMALTVFSGALGLGIGIGLQKVFSNLVSGIVLLMDKSIKPGDVIAIGDTYGWVNKLGARHVSLITRDGKEHLLPNENMIIEKVENWSYSNEKIRIHIPVGISYDSDIKLGKALMLEAVSEHVRILDTPAPVCLIMGFGDSSVDFEIRAWIADPQSGISNVKSAVYESIWDKFKENGIQIPFPQRDLHIKTLNESLISKKPKLD